MTTQSLTKVNTDLLKPYIKEVIEHFITLKKDGANWECCCPFHDEKTPSFKVQPSKNRYKCFGDCGAGGDVISFVKKYKNVSFKEACTIIQDIINVDASTTEINYEKRPTKHEKAKEVKEYDKPTKVQQTLSNKTLEYFQNRGISEKTLELFNVKESVHYFAQLQKKTTSIDFNYYRNKELVNIKHRSLEQKAFALEKNCELVLWNIDNIEKDTDTIYITEGEIDALSLSESLYTNKNIISVPNGANNIQYLECSKTLELIKNKNLVLFFDNDNAGKSLTDAFLERFGNKCLVPIYPDDCKDLNDVLLVHGKNEIIEILNNVYLEQAKKQAKEKAKKEILQKVKELEKVKKQSKKKAFKEKLKQKKDFDKDCKKNRKHAQNRFLDTDNTLQTSKNKEFFKTQKGKIPDVEFEKNEIYKVVGKYAYVEVNRNSFKFQHNFKDVQNYYNNVKQYEIIKLNETLNKKYFNEIILKQIIKLNKTLNKSNNLTNLKTWNSNNELNNIDVFLHNYYLEYLNGYSKINDKQKKLYSYLLGKKANAHELSILLKEINTNIDITKENYFEFVRSRISKLKYLGNSKEQIFIILEMHILNVGNYNYTLLDKDTGELQYKKITLEELENCYNTAKILKPKQKCVVWNPKHKISPYYKQIIQAKELKKLNTQIVQQATNTINTIITIKDISEKTQLSRSTVERNLKELGISIVGNKKQKTKELVQNLRNENPQLTQKEVANNLNLSINTVKSNWNLIDMPKITKE